MGRAKAGMNARSPGGEQTIAGHGKENAGLTNLEDEQDGGGGEDCAEGDDASGPVQAAGGKGGSERFGSAELFPIEHTGQNDSNGDVDDRANDKAGNHADGHVALGIAGFFGGGG